VRWSLAMGGRLSEGIYEHLVTEELARALDDPGPARTLLDSLPDSEAPGVFARHLAGEIHACSARFRRISVPRRRAR
jgi:hypothetical protein